MSSDSEEEDDINPKTSPEVLDSDVTTTLEKMKVSNEEQNNGKFFYKRLARHYLADEVRKDSKEAILTAAAYHRDIKILITGTYIIPFLGKNHFKIYF